MKNIIIILTVWVGMQNLYSQAYQGNNDKKLQAGVNLFGYGSGITGSFDYGLTEFISIGIGAEFYLNNDTTNSNNSFIFGRANIHLGDFLNLPKEMDLYPGLNLGLLGSQFGIGAHLGYRYFFNDKLGAFIEIGNHGSLGISYNF